MTCVTCDYKRGTRECGCGCNRLVCSGCDELYPPMTEEARAVYAAVHTTRGCVMRCRAATDGFPYEHFHECTKPYYHRLYDEPDNDVHLCSCGARWRPQRLDTDARGVAFVAARRWARDHGHQQPDDRMLAIVYDAAVRAALSTPPDTEETTA